MKSKHRLLLAITMMMLAAAPCAADVQNPKIALVNFKTCVEKSKLGKLEQANFDNMKKQMEEVLAEKEKTIKEITQKFNDEDYMDGLSTEAENELKHKFKTLSQEAQTQQQQFFQVLQQANFKIIQKLNEEINKIAKEIAQTKKYDIILNEEGSFYFNPALDISEEIIKLMDANFKQPETKS